MTEMGNAFERREEEKTILQPEEEGRGERGRGEGADGSVLDNYQLFSMHKNHKDLG